jgi:hypothetical protein
MDGKSNGGGSLNVPEEEELKRMAKRHATHVAQGEEPWGSEYTFDLTGLTNLLDEFIDGQTQQKKEGR